eukprot:XP_001703265.1 predicted protein [Chlamydomonas reinhardtii]
MRHDLQPEDLASLLASLPRLQELALRLTGHLALRRLPSWLPARLGRLSELELVRCGLRLMPEPALAGLRRLRLLSLDGCPLGEGEAAPALPRGFGTRRLTRLETLELAGCMGRLRASVLRYLRESGDRGFELLEGCSRLQHLGLGRCGLAALPPAVAGGRLAGLTSLDVSGNVQLQLLPPPLALQPHQPGRWQQLAGQEACREAGDAGGQGEVGAGVAGAAALAELRRALPALRHLDIRDTPAAALAAAWEAGLRG